MIAYWTIRRQTNSQSVKSQTGKLADSEFLKITELLHNICTLNLVLSVTLTRTNCVMYLKSHLEQ